jgi:hypothetical protein
MGQRGQHVGSTLDSGSRLLPRGQTRHRVTAMAGVGKDVPFWMPDRILGNAPQGVYFREVLDPSSRFEKSRPGRWNRALLRPFEPLPREPVPWQAPGTRP